MGVSETRQMIGILLITLFSIFADWFVVVDFNFRLPGIFSFIFWFTVFTWRWRTLFCLPLGSLSAFSWHVCFCNIKRYCNCRKDTLNILEVWKRKTIQTINWTLPYLFAFLDGTKKWAPSSVEDKNLILTVRWIVFYVAYLPFAKNACQAFAREITSFLE